MDIKTISTILHIIGVAIGAGGAYMSDLIFMHSIKDRKIVKTEMTMMNLGSKMTWVGLAILIISGILLFATNPERYLASSKFQVKMAIVLMLTLNGLVFHFLHIPRIKHHQGHHYPSSDDFRRNAVWLLLSGVVSVVSWTLAIVLGSLRSIEYTFFQAFVIYIVIIFISFVFALALKNRIFFKEKK